MRDAFSLFRIRLAEAYSTFRTCVMVVIVAPVIVFGFLVSDGPDVPMLDLIQRITKPAEAGRKREACQRGRCKTIATKESSSC